MAGSQSDIERQLDEASRENEKAKSSIDWLRGKFRDLFGGGRGKPELTKGAGKRFPRELNRSFMTNKINQRAIGRMMMFAYDPKTKEKLPYYDVFPLVIVVDMTPDGFTGLNLHYVYPTVRMKILEALIHNINPEHLMKDFLSRNVENKQIAMNYRVLKDSSRFEFMKPCFKRYLFSHVRSSFLYIDPKEWPKAVMLPTEQFKKSTKARVYRESQKRYGRR